MINLLTEVVEPTSSFDFKYLLTILIIFIPVLFAIIASKRWNAIHGILTYFLVSYVLLYVFTFNMESESFDFSTSLLVKIFGEEYSLTAFSYLFIGAMPIMYIVEQLCNVEFFMDLLMGDKGQHIILATLTAVFVISQIIGSKLRSNR